MPPEPSKPIEAAPRAQRGGWLGNHKLNRETQGQGKTFRDWTK